MLRNIILAFVGFVIVALIVLWFLNGGPRKAYEGIRGFASSNATTSEGLSLPWQPPGLFPFIDEEAIFAEETSISEDELTALQQEYQNVSPDSSDVLTFGNPSPHFRTVHIVGGLSDPRVDRPQEEYVQIAASISNTAPTSLAGWSLQSALTGVRVYISSGASPFWAGTVNAIAPVSLNPGMSATLVTGASPVGISFQENICSGYLAQFQPFFPSLSLQCPAPETEVPLTADNLQRYGEACFDFIRAIPICEFPQQMAPHLSVACQSYIQTILTYNGCVGRHLSEPSFNENMWRLYFGSAVELWRNRHDAIRLLDAQGQTVDVYVY